MDTIIDPNAPVGSNAAGAPTAPVDIPAPAAPVVTAQVPDALQIIFGQINDAFVKMDARLTALENAAKVAPIAAPALSETDIYNSLAAHVSRLSIKIFGEV